MHMYFVYAEINLLGIMILMVFYVNQRHAGFYSLDDHLFNGVLLVTSFVLLLDAALWLLDGVVYPGGHVMLIALTSLSYVVNPMIAYIWILYCDLRIYSDARRMKTYALLYASPLLLNALMVVINLFVPLLFTIEPGNVYHRGSCFFIYLAVYYAYLIWSSVIVLRKITHCDSPTERRDFLYMLLFAIPPFIGGALQTVFYGTSFAWPFTVISIVIVYTNVLNRQISTDSLTGLNNRRTLQRYLEQKITSADAGSSLFLVMLDCDDFKWVNDAFGHAAGDRALVQISEILKTICRHQDCFLARLGGDEFVIVGEEKGGFQLEWLEAEIEARISHANQACTEPYCLSISSGSARFSPSGPCTADALLIAADRCMYRAKAQRKAAKETKKAQSNQAVSDAPSPLPHAGEAVRTDM